MKKHILKQHNFYKECVLISVHTHMYTHKTVKMKPQNVNSAYFLMMDFFPFCIFYFIMNLFLINGASETKL